MLTIKNHRLFQNNVAVEYKQSPNYTKNFLLKPEGIVVHDTAGRLDGDTSVSWFMNKAARASAHLVVHRSGHITQMVPFNKKAWHAGVSSLNGTAGVNNFSLGIEIANPGKLTPLGRGKYQAWFGEVFTDDDNDYDIIEKSTHEHGSGGWMTYTREQLDIVEQLCVSLFAKYHLEWLWPHWKVSPGRKIDTNPLFPLTHLQSKLLGRAGDAENLGVMLANTNHRRWPSYNDNIIQVIPRGKKVGVIRGGWYQNGDDYANWFLVSFDSHEGWVHGSLIEL